MEITLVAIGEKKKITIRLVEGEDFKKLTKKRFSFSWKSLKSKAELYKLQIAGEDDILGVMALTDFPAEKRIEIKLLACATENIGKKKVYGGIAGCLIAFACRQAKVKYGLLACVSLVPKTELKLHYIEKYKMLDAGWQLYLEGNPLNDIILKYLL